MAAIQFAKDIIKKLPYPLLARAYYLYSRSTFQRIQNIHIKKFGLPGAGNINPVEVKKSDDLFILGSGSSINGIDETRWRQIRSGDSFGFNFWICHDHVPDLYAFELPLPQTYGGMGKEVIDKLLFWAAERQEDYRETVKLVTDIGPGRMRTLDALPPIFRDNLYAGCTIPAFARNKKELHYYISFLKDRGVFEREHKIRSLFKYRATLSMMIALGVKLGYRRICLCGVDLNDSDYFYQDAEKYPDMVNFRSSLNTRTHATLVKKPMLMPIDEVVYALDDLVVKPQGAKLFVENEHSALYPRLELFPREEAWENAASSSSNSSAATSPV